MLVKEVGFVDVIDLMTNYWFFWIKEYIYQRGIQRHITYFIVAGFFNSPNVNVYIFLLTCILGLNK